MTDKTTAQIRALERIQGSLKAAHDDVQAEEGSAREGDGIDVCMLDGAIHHATEGLRELRQLRASLVAAGEG